MNNNYLSPEIEIIEVEIEDAVLQTSASNTIEKFTDGGSFGEIWED